MTEKMLPIAFSPSMVKRILARAKTRTRRLFTPPKSYEVSKKLDERGWPLFGLLDTDITIHARCPFGERGQLLWMREGIRRSMLDGREVAVYTATSEVVLVDGKPLAWRWKPSFLASRYCSREASRVVFRNTLVRVERLQTLITEEAVAEGIELVDHGEVPRYRDPITGNLHAHAPGVFASAWNILHTTPGERWEDNPWVWVVGFEEVERRPAGVQIQGAVS